MSDATTVEMDQPAIVVSCDSHAGPKLMEQLRAYCPQQYLEQFDEDAAAQAKQAAGMLGAMSARMSHPNLDLDGHWDPQARLRDMDSDGVAAELIWHFSQNGENLPWIGQGLGTVFKHQFELGAVAYEIYNRWLADFCSEDAERLLGLVYIPSWDIDASIKTLEWARENGLRCLNFPAPSRPGVTEYNDPAWDPFWSACTDLGFALSTHSSGGPFFDFTRGPGGMQIIAYEGGSWLARRGVWILTYGEVFQRHPELKLVITEQVEGLVRAHDARARLLLPHVRIERRSHEAPERVHPPERVPRRELHLAVAGRRRGRARLRRQRAVGSRLSAHRGRLPGHARARRGTDDEARAAPRVLEDPHR